MTQALLSFSALLKQIRKEAGINQQKLADQLSVSKVYIGMVESGMKPATTSLVRSLAEKLEVHPMVLMPFLESGEENFTPQTSLEKQFVKWGLVLQKKLIKKKSQKLIIT